MNSLEPSRTLSHALLPASTIWAVGAMFVVSSLVMLTLPAIVSALVTTGRVSAEAAGFVVGIDLLGQVLGTMAVLRRDATVSCKRWLWLGLAILVLGNAASCFAQSSFSLFAWRLIAGVGAGMLRATAFAVFANTRDPARVIALTGAAQIAAMAGAFMWFPWATQQVGWFGPYLILCALAILMYLTVPWWPSHLPSQDVKRGSRRIPVSGWACLAGALTYFWAQAAIWAFVANLGENAGVASDSMNKLLAGVAIAGLAASAVASLASSRIGVASALQIGLFTTLLALLILAVSQQTSTFGLGLYFFYFAWAATVPFQFAATAQADRTGRSSASFGAADGIGLALGPPIGGLLLVHSGPLSLVLFAAAFSVVSIYLFIYGLRRPS